MFAYPEQTAAKLKRSGSASSTGVREGKLPALGTRSGSTRGFTGSVGSTSHGSPGRDSGRMRGAASTINLRRQMSKLKALNSSDQSVIEDLNGQLVGAQTTLTQQAADMAALQRNYEKISLLGKSDRDQIAALKAELQTRQEQIDTLVDESKSAKELRLDLEILQKDSERQKNALAEARASAARADARLVQSKLNLNKAQHEKASLSRSLSVLQEELAELKRRHSEAVESLAKPLDELRALKAELATARTAAADANKAKTEAQAEAVKSAANLDGAKAKAARLETEAADLSSKMARTQADFESVVRLRASDASEIQSLGQVVAGLKAQILGLKNKVDTIPDLQNTVYVQGTAVNEQAAELVQLREKLEAAATTLTNEKEAASRATEAHRQELYEKERNHKNTLGFLHAERDKLRDMIADRDKTVLKLRSQFGQDTGSLQSAITDLEGELETTRSKAAADLAAANEAAAAAAAHSGSHIAGLQSEIAELNDALVSAQSRLAELDEAAVNAKLTSLAEREGRLQSTLAQLLHAQEAMEVTLTCMACLQIYTSPTVCLPCRHTYCAACVSLLQAAAGSDTAFCKECGDGSSVVSTFTNDSLDSVASKYVYQKQALVALAKAASDASPKDHPASPH